MNHNKTGISQASNLEDALSAIDSVVQEGEGMMELTPVYFLVQEGPLDGGCEDGISLSRRSVLTEPLPPATRPPEARPRGRYTLPV